MTNYREIIRLNNQAVSQRGIAASCSCSRNTVAKVLIKASENGLTWPLDENLSNRDIHILFFPPEPFNSSRKQPDYEYVHREMAKSHVTMSLLWDEYCNSCSLNKEIPLMYTQFCLYYRQFALRTKATMHIVRKPGEQLEVDWAGKYAQIIDRDTGEIINVSVFIGALSCSQYAYVEAFLSKNLECWIAAHVNMFQYFGGSTRILTPDNLKTGVEKISWYDTKINQSYQELAEHYRTAVIPARAYHPKDKPNAEGVVGITSTWIIAALRNQQFFNLIELNNAIWEKLEIFNEKPFQKRPGSRYSVFVDEEKDTLLPLPATRYELATWQVATVQFNYHIAIEKNYYSVSYEYIRQKVDVRITRSTIEIFLNQNRLCSHVRLHGRSNQYSTVLEHMPDDHKKYVEWNPERFIDWAKSIGANTAVVVKAILSNYKVKQQGFRSCMALLKLSQKHSAIRLEKACEKALTYTPRPSFHNVKTILLSGQDQLPENPQTTKPKNTSHGFTRGADYYGRNS